MKRITWLLCLLALALFLAAPFLTQAAHHEGKAASPEKMGKMEKKEKMKKPGAAGKELWDYLAKKEYAKKFTLWPGKEKLYKGAEPHGALLTTYVNKKALEAIQGKKGVLPAGSIVVKENYTPEKKLAAITVMYKVDKYNPEANDWFWAKYNPDGSIDKEGKVAGCIGCHAKAKDNDYLFTGKLK